MLSPTTLMVPLLQFLAPNRLWLLLLIPALVGLYLFLVRRKRSRTRQVGQTMLDLVIPRETPWRRHLAVAGARPRQTQTGGRFSRNAATPSRAGGSWLVCAMTPIAWS